MRHSNSLYLKLLPLLTLVALLCVPGCAGDKEVKTDFDTVKSTTFEVRKFGDVYIVVDPARESKQTTLCAEPGWLVKWVNPTDVPQRIAFNAEDKFPFGISAMEIAPGESVLLQVPEDAPPDKDHRYRLYLNTSDLKEYVDRINKANAAGQEAAEVEKTDWVPYGGPEMIVCPPGTSPCN